MRERLTASFVAITLILLLGTVRSLAGDDENRASERDAVAATATALQAVVSDTIAEGG